jgi:two-component system, OmpR family, alkaline phosphatase synthesis response regulator PhoP
MQVGRDRSAGDAQAPKPVVLIVDDNPDILLLLETNIRRAGFGVVKAGDGEMALRSIQEDRPDVVLLDLMMPVLDGWGVLERLAGKDCPPIIIISAATSQTNVDKAYEMGAVGYITKPFSLSEMIEKINQVLAAPDPAESPPTPADRLPRRPVG